MSLFFGILIFLLVGGLIAWSFYARAQRRKAISAWVAGRGWRFDARPMRGRDDRYSSFRFLRHGSNRFAYNRVAMFPSSLVAGVAGFLSREYFEIDEVIVRGVPAVAP